MDNQEKGLTDRMGKVDGNLIYMLWQLLVVRQEFNKVNTDWAEKDAGNINIFQNR